jgi:hypothetical protein
MEFFDKNVFEFFFIYLCFFFFKKKKRTENCKHPKELHVKIVIISAEIKKHYHPNLGK